MLSVRVCVYVWMCVCLNVVIEHISLEFWHIIMISELFSHAHSQTNKRTFIAPYIDVTFQAVTHKNLLLQ